MEHVPAPDFPTGGIILGRSGARKAYLEGRGSVILRAKTRVEEIRKDRYAIVVDEIPLPDEQGHDDREDRRSREREETRGHRPRSRTRATIAFGVRVVIELKRDATPEVVLNQLWRFTPLQTSFGANMLALNGGKPEQLTLRGFSHPFHQLP